MTPRPFYRWKSFWFGILVLGFIGWAWRDCSRNKSYITMTWQRWGTYHEICRAKGATLVLKGTGFRLTSSADIPDAAKWHGRFRVMRIPMPYLERDSTTETIPRIPDAAVFFSVFALWLAWLLFHWKREQRKLSA